MLNLSEKLSYAILHELNKNFPNTRFYIELKKVERFRVLELVWEELEPEKEAVKSALHQYRLSDEYDYMLFRHVAKTSIVRRLIKKDKRTLYPFIVKVGLADGERRTYSGLFPSSAEAVQDATNRFSLVSVVGMPI